MNAKIALGCVAVGLVAGVGCGSASDTTKSTGSTSGTTTASSGGGGAGQGGAGATTTTGSGGAGVGGSTGSGGAGGAPAKIEHVFIVLMENHNWSDIVGSASAPYLNSLLSQGAHADHYMNPPGLHPSEPNYLWLEAGTHFGVTNDKEPSANHQSTDAHLVTQLEKAGFTWKSYQEDIPGTDCPLTAFKKYAPKHNPMVYFDDVTDSLDPMSANCIAHVRPYPTLADDLAADTVPSYAFITPNLCHDMHDLCAPENDRVAQGDHWLSTEVPKILASKAFQSGVLFITWDESANGDHPIGMIVLSPFAKKGYAGSTPYTHSSTLRTVQEIFGLSPWLGDAANATSLSDLFTTLP
jgi:phospholipase C